MSAAAVESAITRTGSDRTALCVAVTRLLPVARALIAERTGMPWWFGLVSRGATALLDALEDWSRTACPGGEA